MKNEFASIYDMLQRYCKVTSPYMQPAQRGGRVLYTISPNTDQYRIWQHGDTYQIDYSAKDTEFKVPLGIYTPQEPGSLQLMLAAKQLLAFAASKPLPILGAYRAMSTLVFVTQESWGKPVRIRRYPANGSKIMPELSGRQFNAEAWLKRYNSGAPLVYKPSSTTLIGPYNNTEEGIIIEDFKPLYFAYILYDPKKHGTTGKMPHIANDELEAMTRSNKMKKIKL